MKKILLIIFPLASLKGYSQLNQAVIDSTKYPRLTTFTAQQDHENMKQQLGIHKLRPGPSGNESAPNHANYDDRIS
jgi:hypothetical protein